MRRATWKVISGLVLTVVAAELGIRILEPALPSSTLWPSTETALKSEQLERIGEEVKVVFLGSSSTEAAVDPELLRHLTGDGLPYNAALPFSSPLSDQIWVSDVILDASSPDLAVIGIPPWPAHTTLGADPLRAGLTRAVDLRDRGPGRLTPSLIAHKGLLGDWDERATNDELLESGLWTDLGHQTGYYDRPFASIAGAFPPFGTPEMNGDNSAALRDVVRMFREAGTDVIFMIEPGRYPGDVPAGVVDEYVRSVTALADDLAVPIWDLHGVDWDPADFADEAHPNRAGTVAITNHVAELLAAVT